RAQPQGDVAADPEEPDHRVCRRIRLWQVVPGFRYDRGGGPAPALCHLSRVHPESVPKYERPHVDAIEHLTTPVIVDQRGLSENARSTVGPITDISAMMRVLFATPADRSDGSSVSDSYPYTLDGCPVTQAYHSQIHFVLFSELQWNLVSFQSYGGILN